MKDKDFMNQKAGEMTISELAEAIKMHQRLAVEPAKVEEKKTLSDKLSKCGCCEIENRKVIKQSLKEFITFCEEMINKINPPHIHTDLSTVSKEIFGERLIHE